MAKRALITGITGQDGSYLAELLLDEGYEVFGTMRRLSAPNRPSSGCAPSSTRTSDRRGCAIKWMLDWATRYFPRP